MYQFSPISPRVQRQRALYRETVPYVDINRYRLVTEFYMAHPEIDGVLKRALNFRNLCEKLPCPIFEDDLIVGNFVERYRATALYPENSIDWLVEELKSGLLWERKEDPYRISEEDKDYILSTADFWMGECMNSKLNAYIPENYQKIAGNGVLFFTAQNICPQPVGHFSANFDRAIRKGFGAIKAEADAKILELEQAGFLGESARQYSFYRGVSIVCEGMITFAKRYAQACAAQAEQTADPNRRLELMRMADTMDWVMEHPARNFREAIQALWFYQMCVLMDANCHAASIGRLDQHLGSFAQADLDAGIITREEVQELVDLYLLKTASVNKAWSARTVRSAPGYTSGQLITLGGVDREESDATNVITYMTLEAAGRLVLHSPPLALRVNRNMPKELWDCALSVNKRAGGVPSFYSDDVIRKALEKRGIKTEDTWNYCLIGCVEPSIGGAEWPACGGLGISSYMNLANVFLLAINNGKNPRRDAEGTLISDVQFGPETGYLYEMNSIEEVQAAYLRQMEYWVTWNINIDNMFESVASQVLPQPVVSAAMDGCMEQGRDVMEGGARYNSTGLSSIGLGNVADCLSIVDRLCFREKRCTTRELYDALTANWTGYEDLRQYLMGSLPRYGNGDPEVDKFCRWVAQSYADCANSKTGPRGHFAAGLYPVTMNVVYGTLTGATPDGRMSGEPLSDGISAVQGMDKSGPTAILRSVTCFDHTDFSNGTLLNMKFHPTVLANADGFEKLRQLMYTYFFQMGGGEMQLNIVSADTLRDAQKHPENYKDLVVRIAGFSAYFVEVYKTAQDDLIRRTELCM